MIPISEKEFQYISSRIYQYAGINLTEKKRNLVISRLGKRIRGLGLTSFSEYIQYLEEDEEGVEFLRMVDALSTNYTTFFRESVHLDFLEDYIFPEADPRRPLNIWSAAASTGQEIYSILITMLEYQREHSHEFSCNLYASDISRPALKKASRGIYPEKELDKVDDDIKARYFLKGRNRHNDLVKIKNDLIRRVKFFRMNLKDDEYKIPLMDVVFLRNVIIYFDRQTKTELINKLYDYIAPGGYLLLGHSETLTGVSTKFTYVRNTVYRK